MKSVKKHLAEKFQLEGRNDMIEEMEEENFTNIESFKKYWRKMDLMLIINRYQHQLDYESQILG